MTSQGVALVSTLVMAVMMIVTVIWVSLPLREAGAVADGDLLGTVGWALFLIPAVGIAQLVHAAVLTAWVRPRQWWWLGYAVHALTGLLIAGDAIWLVARTSI